MRQAIYAAPFFVLFCFGCTNSSSSLPDRKTMPVAGDENAANSGPVAFTLTADSLAKEYDADPKSFATKYGEQRVELTGVVRGPRIQSSGTNDLLLEGKAKAKEFLAEVIVVTPSKAHRDKHQSLKSLAKGQTVTVRGTVGKYVLQIKESEFVKFGSNPALPVTHGSLVAALANEEGKQKYNGKDVVLRGEIRKVDWNGTVLSYTLTDPGSKDGPSLEASLNPQSKEIGEEMAKAKVGEVVVVLGEAQTLNNGRIWDVRILTEPPEGVTLPSQKK